MLFDLNVRRFGLIPATCFSACSVASVCNTQGRCRLSHSSPAATLAPGGNVVSAGGLCLWALGIVSVVLCGPLGLAVRGPVDFSHGLQRRISADSRMPR